MATRSAAKAHRQSLKRRLRNRIVRGSTKTAIKRADAAIAGGDLESARLAVRAALGSLDRAVSKDVLHANNAARRKSRLFLKFNAAVAAVQAPPAPAARKKRETKPAATRTRRAATAQKKSGRTASSGRKKAAK